MSILIRADTSLAFLCYISWALFDNFQLVCNRSDLFNSGVLCLCAVAGLKWWWLLHNSRLTVVRTLRRAAPKGRTKDELSLMEVPKNTENFLRGEAQCSSIARQNFLSLEEIYAISIRV